MLPSANSYKILLRFSDNDEKLKGLSEVVKSLIKLTCPDLSFQCSGTTTTGHQTIAWYSQPDLSALDADFTDLELGLGPDHGRTKCGDQDEVSMKSVMSTVSTRDKSESPMSMVSGQGDKVMEEEISKTQFLSEATEMMSSLSRQLNNLSDQLSDHSSKMSDHSCKMSEHSCKSDASSGGLGDESEGSSPNDGNSTSTGVVVLSQESGSPEDWDRDTRGTVIYQPPSHTQMTEEPEVIDSREFRASPTRHEICPIGAPGKLQFNIILDIKHADPAKNEDWRKEQEARRKKMPLQNLLVSENVAMRCDRPEDINFAAKHDQERSKKKSGNTPRIGQ